MRTKEELKTTSLLDILEDLRNTNEYLDLIILEMEKPKQPYEYTQLQTEYDNAWKYYWSLQDEIDNRFPGYTNELQVLRKK